MVGCRGGNQNVEGVLVIPLLENKKGFLVCGFGFLVSKMAYDFKRYLVHITKSPFHVFDRYEIHIQDVKECFTGIVIISRCPSSTFELFKNSKIRNAKTEFKIFKSLKFTNSKVRKIFF